MASDLEDRIRRGQYDDIYRSRVHASNRDPRVMRPDEIVEEMTGLRETINLAAQRMIELSRSLLTQSRRHTASQYTPVYVTYANAWGRLAGAVQQGIRRTQNIDRLITEAQKSQKEDYELERSPKRPAKKGASTASPHFEAPNPLKSRNPLEPEAGQGVDDLMKLYGKELVDDAVKRR